MSSRSVWLLCGAIFLAGSIAWACGPDFPSQLLSNRARTLTVSPANTFAYEMAHLVPRPADQFVVAESSGWTDSPDTVTQEKKSLPPDQAEIVWHMRNETDGDSAYSVGDGLPLEIRLYTAAAVDFRGDRNEAAATRLKALLELPSDQRQQRSVWAAFTLGRIRMHSGDLGGAATSFDLARDLARNGLPDPLGLAVASYGEQAKPYLDRSGLLQRDGAASETWTPTKAQIADLGKAVSLYAEQAARGSQSGVNSLRIIAEALVNDRRKAERVISDPMLQRILVAYALARIGDYGSDRHLLVDLFAAIETRGLDKVGSADRLAALAYRLSRYDLAAALAEKTKSPLSSWVKAKLALRSGDMTAAAALYSEASKAFQTSDDDSIEEGNKDLLVGESGVLSLARGEYLRAMQILYPLGAIYWGDVAYIGERVLTVDELKTFVDTARIPEGGFKQPRQDENSETWQLTDDPSKTLRLLLARRLMRVGRYDEAVSYFPAQQDDTPESPNTRRHASDYAAAVKRANNSWWRTDRAAAWYQAAVLARRNGMEMMGTEAAPDQAVTRGDFNWGVGQSKLEGPFAQEEEKKRFEGSAPTPNLRFHYRYLAADELIKAAELLPPRSQAFAAILCRATGWMMGTEGHVVDYDEHYNPLPNLEARNRWQSYYARYVKEGPLVPWATHFGYDCPEPDFDGAARLRWRQPIDQARAYVWRHRRPIAVAAVILSIAGLWGVRRWRRSPKASIS
jgi:tetratricopeptide (TPR) repeat protein